jgi:hypothetical protein
MISSCRPGAKCEVWDLELSAIRHAYKLQRQRLGLLKVVFFGLHPLSISDFEWKTKRTVGDIMDKVVVSVLLALTTIGFAGQAKAASELKQMERLFNQPNPDGPIYPSDPFHDLNMEALRSKIFDATKFDPSYADDRTLNCQYTFFSPKTSVSYEVFMATPRCIANWLTAAKAKHLAKCKTANDCSQELWLKKN